MLKLASSSIRIGILGSEETTPTGRGVGLWASGFKGTIAAAGGEPVILEHAADDETWDDVLGDLQGVVYSGQKDPANPFTEEGLCHWCRSHQLPLLAIDDGMLALNTAFGGGNYLDLARELPEALQHRHRPEPGVRHAIMVERGTILAGLYGEGEIVVNSEHRQGIQRLAQGFLVSARALDGVIEAIEWKNSPWFCMGVQWQPASSTASGLDIQLFRGLIDACSRRHARPRRRMAVGA